MAQGQLRSGRRAAIGCGLVFMILPTMGCAHTGTDLGLSLIFLNRGARPLVTKRIDFDGERGPDPGYLGPGGEGKHMGFMPGDRQRGLPKYIEAEWIVYSNEFNQWSKNTPWQLKNTEENKEIFKKLWATNSQYTQRVDLIPILKPDIVAQVRADRKNTQMKMTIIFRDDKVDITAEPYKWR